jgi:hypothetical protein
VPELGSFNPNIDRFDERSVARLFQSLWPQVVVARTIAENLAASIRVAHAAGEACWEVTMYPHGLRLNVGQVETLSFSDESARFLFQSPLAFSPDPRFEVNTDSSPVYPAVPVSSGVCQVAPSDIIAMPSVVRKAHEAYIQTAASFKQVSPFRRSHSPAVIDYVESALATKLPRPSYASPGVEDTRVDPLPDELDLLEPMIEGARYQVSVNAYERDPRARKLCIASYGTACVICKFSFGAAYGPVAEGFIHVHHVRPLSEIGGKYQVNPTEDLRPVCPNCHAVLHRRVPAFSIEEVQTLIQQQGRAEQGAADVTMNVKRRLSDDD